MMYLMMSLCLAVELMLTVRLEIAVSLIILETTGGCRWEKTATVGSFELASLVAILYFKPAVPDISHVSASRPVLQTCFSYPFKSFRRIGSCFGLFSFHDIISVDPPAQSHRT
ncbi:hypothetical protein JB92DRAFT_2010842 [Gautieria morchelliformis]|nr:hypothetical protein JB92DRAFT_2010842 [Gautieria morchelliformis]